MLSSLQHLDDSARLKEIALMLSGNGYSDNTLNSAAELLSKAAGWKKPATKAARNSIQLKF
jgi:DNA repair ATPase RecN